MILAKPQVWGRMFLTAIIVIFLYHNLPALEGKINPVTTVLDIEVVEATKNGWAVVSGTFTKNRDCSFDRIEWYWGTNKTLTRVAVQFSESKQRASGVQVFEKWRVQMPYSEIKDNSVAYVYHNCHPWYETLTKLYP